MTSKSRKGWVQGGAEVGEIGPSSGMPFQGWYVRHFYQTSQIGQNLQTSPLRHIFLSENPFSHHGFLNGYSRNGCRISGRES